MNEIRFDARVFAHSDLRVERVSAADVEVIRQHGFKDWRGAAFDEHRLRQSGHWVVNPDRSVALMSIGGGAFEIPEMHDLLYKGHLVRLQCGGGGAPAWTRSQIAPDVSLGTVNVTGVGMPAALRPEREAVLAKAAEALAIRMLSPESSAQVAVVFTSVQSALAASTMPERAGPTPHGPLPAREVRSARVPGSASPRRSHVQRRAGPPSWVPALVCVGLALGSALGGWLLQQSAYAETAGRVPAGSVSLHTDALLALPSLNGQSGQVVELVGRFQRDKTVLVSGHTMYGQKGYAVYTPLQLRRGQGRTVVVLQGWIPEQAAHDEVRLRLHTPQHELVVRGVLTPMASAAQGAQAGQGLIRSAVGLDDFGGPGHPGYLPLIVRQTYGPTWTASDVRNSHFKRHWPDLYPAVERRMLAGRLCFGVAAVCLGLALWLATRARARGQRPTPRTAARPPAGAAP